MYFRFLILLVMLLPEFAMAADLFTPVAGDRTMQLLVAMFGNLGVFSPSSSDAFVNVIATFNGAVLIVGGILVAYTIVVGTIGTAHDGEMLGKKFSSVWVPIRTAMGTALILPVIGGGYCIMQAIVGWLIVQGIGLADNVWGSYMSAGNIAKEVSVGLESPNNEQVAWKLFASIVCMDGYQKIYNTVSAQSPYVWQPVTFGPTTKTTANGSTIIYFGVPTGDAGFTYNSCGSIKFSKTEPFGVTALASTGINLLGDIGTLNGLVKAGDAKHLAAVNTLISDIHNVANPFVTSSNQAGVEAGIKQAVAKYSQSTKDAGASILAKLADFNELEKSSTRDGWGLAGAWYMRMSYLMDIANRTVVKTPEASGINMLNDDINSIFKDSFVKNYSSGLNNFAEVNNGETGISNSVSQSDVATGGSGIRGMWDLIKSGFNIDTLIKKMFLGVTKFAVDSNSHPVMAMKAVGNWTLGIAALTLPLYVAGMTALATATQGGGVATTIALLPVALMIWPILITIGVTLSYVLPMMPFIIWIGVVLGWIILCVEAIIAAPMWAVMHLSPNGDDMVGTASQGYRLVLSLILRPVLMIFGLIAALTIITVFGKLLNQVFFSVFILSQQDSNFIVLIVGMIASPLIYMGMMWTFITKTMTIIHVIPDQLLQWFGGGGAQLGDYGQTMGGHGSTTFAAIGSSGGGGLASKALDADRNRRDLVKQYEQASLQKENNKIAQDNQLNKSKEGINNKGGGGSASIVEQGLKNMGIENPGTSDFEGYQGSKMSSSIQDAGNSLGGVGSPEHMEFKENMANDLASGKSFSEAYDKNISQAIDSKHGSGAAEFLSKSSGGSMSGSDYAKALEQISTIQSMYRKLSPNQIKEKTSALISSAMKDVGNSGGSISEAVNSKIDFAYNNSNSVDKSAITPPSAEKGDGGA